MPRSVNVLVVRPIKPWISDLNNPQQWLFELPWWDDRIRDSDHRFRAVQINQGYQDHIAILTKEEFEKRNQEFWHHYEQDSQYSASLHLAEKQKLDLVIESLTDIVWFIVQVYEWESGF